MFIIKENYYCEPSLFSPTKWYPFARVIHNKIPESLSLFFSVWRIIPEIVNYETLLLNAQQRAFWNSLREEAVSLLQDGRRMTNRWNSCGGSATSTWWRARTHRHFCLVLSEGLICVRIEIVVPSRCVFSFKCVTAYERAGFWLPAAPKSAVIVIATQTLIISFQLCRYTLIHQHSGLLRPWY